MNSYTCCTNPESKQISSLTSMLKVVSESSRLKILCILHQGEHCVCEITKNINLSQSLISHYLQDLKEAGIIQSEKRGLYVHYSLTNEGKRITDLLFQI